MKRLFDARHIFPKGLSVLLTVMLLTLLTGCVHSDGDTMPGVILSLRFPADEMSMQPGVDLTRSAENPGRRCIVELYRPGTRTPVMRKAVRLHRSNPERVRLAVELTSELMPGKYDIAVWSDCISGDDAAKGIFYDTPNLGEIRIPLGEDYPRDVAPKEAAYAFLHGVDIGYGERSIDVNLKRPLARYVVLSEDVETYMKFIKRNPKFYPPLDELIFVIRYQFYFPVGFDVLSGKPIDASLDMGYTTHVSSWDKGEPGKICVIADDVILTGNQASYLTIELEVHGPDGRVYSRTKGLRVDFRQGYQTVIRGNFLTLGTGTSLIFDTSWEDDIIYDI